VGSSTLRRRAWRTVADGREARPTPRKRPREGFSGCRADSQCSSVSGLAAIRR
jgi:hypothetical protein